MAKKGRFIEKPNVINNWLIFGNFVDAVLVKFQSNVWDEELKKEVLIVEYIPTDVMRYLEEMYFPDEDDYDSTTGSFRSKYPMDMVYIEPRTQGTRILLLCDYKGNKCNVFEKINQNLLEKNRKLQSQVNSLNSILIGLRADMDEMIKHPEESLRKLYQLAKIAKESMTPTIINTQGGVETSGGGM